MDTLHVICKSCGQAFESPVQLTREAFGDRANEIHDNRYQCPRCGASYSYEKVDHIWR